MRYRTRLLPKAIDDVRIKSNTALGKAVLLEIQMAEIVVDGGTISVPTWWEDAVDEVKALQVGINCVTFPFDPQICIAGRKK